MISISYAITAHNEHKELKRLLNQLDKNIRDIDEVVIQLDITATKQVKDVCYEFPFFSLWEFPLNKDFASFKNNLKSKCSRDYIFFIDADEYLSETLIVNLPEILELNPEIGIFSVPRINTVEGLTEAHIQRWGWSINKEGWVNYPDPQTRICKNIEDISWVGKVHERLTANKSILKDLFPLYHNLDLIHPKDIIRQEKQNQFYNSI